MHILPVNTRGGGEAAREGSLCAEAPRGTHEVGWAVTEKAPTSTTAREIF
jgi:hypothetical protein